MIAAIEQQLDCGQQNPTRAKPVKSNRRRGNCREGS